MEPAPKLSHDLADHRPIGLPAWARYKAEAVSGILRAPNNEAESAGNGAIGGGFKPVGALVPCI
jgi:hypothetical protein